MLDKIKSAELRYDEISRKLMDPTVINDNAQYKSLMKEYKTLTPLVEKYREYQDAKVANDEARELLEEAGLDRELKEMAQ